MNKCKDCDYFLPKYQECEHPDVPYSKANFCSPNEEACEFFEQMSVEKKNEYIIDEFRAEVGCENCCKSYVECNQCIKEYKNKELKWD